MKVVYGNDTVFFDVTHVLLPPHLSASDALADAIIIPGGNVARAFLFGYPIIQNSVVSVVDDFSSVPVMFEENAPILLELVDKDKLKRYRLASIDGKYGRHAIALQYVTQNFVSQGQTVIEIGHDDYGTVACTAFERTGPEGCVLSLKFNVDIAAHAIATRDASGLSFPIEDKVLSSVPLCINIDMVKPAESHDDIETWKQLDAWTFDDMCTKHSSFRNKIDVLLLAHNLRAHKSVVIDMPEVLYATTIVLKNDFMTISDWLNSRDALINAGFTCVFKVGSGDGSLRYSHNMIEVYRRQT